MIDHSSFFDELSKISNLQVGRLLRIAKRASEMVGTPMGVGSAIGTLGLSGGVVMGRKRKKRKEK